MRGRPSRTGRSSRRIRRRTRARAIRSARNRAARRSLRSIRSGVDRSRPGHLPPRRKRRRGAHRVRRGGELPAHGAVPRVSRGGGGRGPGRGGVVVSTADPAGRCRGWCRGQRSCARRHSLELATQLGSVSAGRGGARVVPARGDRDRPAGHVGGLRLALPRRGGQRCGLAGDPFGEGNHFELYQNLGAHPIRHQGAGGVVLSRRPRRSRRGGSRSGSPRS